MSYSDLCRQLITQWCCCYFPCTCLWLSMGFWYCLWVSVGGCCGRLWMSGVPFGYLLVVSSSLAVYIGCQNWYIGCRYWYNGCLHWQSTSVFIAVYIGCLYWLSMGTKLCKQFSYCRFCNQYSPSDIIRYQSADFTCVMGPFMLMVTCHSYNIHFLPIQGWLSFLWNLYRCRQGQNIVLVLGNEILLGNIKTLTAVRQ